MIYLGLKGNGFLVNEQTYLPYISIEACLLMTSITTRDYSPAVIDVCVCATLFHKGSSIPSPMKATSPVDAH